MDIAIEATGGARTPRQLYVPPTPHTERGGLLKGTDRAVTTYRLPLQTCNTRFIKGHKPSNHIHARIKSHVYTIE